MIMETKMYRYKNTYTADELGCVFSLAKQFENGKIRTKLAVAPLNADGSHDEFYFVDEEAVGKHIVTFRGRKMPLSEVYAIVKPYLRTK
jgi:hypothetical protein